MGEKVTDKHWKDITVVNGSKMKFSKPKVYAFVVYAPKNVSLRDADVQFNNFISEKANGLALYHDHFVDKPGAVALFYVESQSELDGLETHSSLEGWDVKVHPLTFTEKPIEFYISRISRWQSTEAKDSGI